MDLSLRPVDLDDTGLARLAEFLTGVFDRPELFTPDYLRWMYRENPAGPVIGTNAWDRDALAGHYAIIPIRSETAAGVHRSALSLNTAVGAPYRLQKLFQRLGEATYASAREQGIVEVIGVANARSTTGMVRLGFRDCGPLEARISFRPPRLASPAPPSWRRAWDEESIRWRSRNPQVRYSAHEHVGTRMLTSPTAWPGIRVVLRMEAAAEAVALPAVRRSVRPPLYLWLGRRGDVVLPAGLPIPIRLRPSPLNLVYRTLDAQHAEPDPERIQLEAFDFDAY